MPEAQSFQSVMADYMDTAQYKLLRFETAVTQHAGQNTAENAINESLAFVEELRADLADLQMQWNSVQAKRTNAVAV